MKKLTKHLLPIGITKALKYIYYSLQDLTETLTGKRDKSYPPKRLNFVGSSDFKHVGDEFIEHFKRIGDLKPTDNVLDIGCGIGRIAIPLTKHLNEKGSLDGFDIDKRGIKWCQKNITPHHPNFRFQYVDIFNKYYNKKGKIPAEKFTFPYENAQFDFVFATSVFTHMLPIQVEQYVREIARVLKPNGKAFLTFFSIDKTAEENIKNGLAYCKLTHKYENYPCFYSRKNVPEAEIGFEESWIKEIFAKNHLGANMKIFHGKWSGGKDWTSYQDILFSNKNADSSSRFDIPR